MDRLVEKARRGDVQAFEELVRVAERIGKPWPQFEIPWSVVSQSSVADMPKPFTSVVRKQESHSGELGSWELLKGKPRKTLREEVELAFWAAKKGTVELLPGHPHSNFGYSVRVRWWEDPPTDFREFYAFVRQESYWENVDSYWIDALYDWMRE